MLGPHTPATAPAVEFQRAETGLSAPEHRSSADRPIRCHWRCFGASGRRLSGVHSPCGRCAYVVFPGHGLGQLRRELDDPSRRDRGAEELIAECPAPSGEAQASPPKTHAPVWNETEVWPKSAALSLACLLVSLQAAQCWQNQQKLLRLCLNNPSKAAPLPNPEAQDTSVHPH